MRFLLLSLTLTTAVGASACARESQVDALPTGNEPDEGTLLEGPGWRGVLLDAPIDHLQLEDGTVVEDVRTFVPEEADVMRFEELLPDALANATNPSGDVVTRDDLRNYARQYTGVEGAGARQLLVSAICDDMLDSFDGWEDHWVEVSDGGACFWQASMDLVDEEIFHLGFNGSA